MFEFPLEVEIKKPYQYLDDLKNHIRPKKFFSKEFVPYIIGQFVKNKKKKILLNEKIKW